MSEVTSNDIRCAYRLFLNREPESDSAVLDKLSSFASIGELRDAFVSSSEFQCYAPSLNQQTREAYYSEPAHIEVDVSPRVLLRLMERVNRQWASLGEGEPYWSVLSDGGFLRENINESSLTNFYDSGRESAGLVDLFCHKAERSALKGGVCFELGCGVGRVTRHLASKFDRVVAVDISPGNLEICKTYMLSEGIQNVDAVLIRSPDDLEGFAEFDCFYSVITLQHNSPPIQKSFLKLLLPKIRKGGVCLFQTPASARGYSFQANSYLNSKEATMDMHCLPQHVVLQCMEDAGLKPLMVVPDNWVQYTGSYTYFGHKP